MKEYVATPHFVTSRSLIAAQRSAMFPAGLPGANEAVASRMQGQAQGVDGDPSSVYTALTRATTSCSRTPAAYFPAAQTCNATVYRKSTEST
jgi:hypothetical protein